MARIELKELAHSYHAKPRSTDDYALQDLDITLEHGTAYALLGASGCGKTTLLNIVSGLITPTRGKILFDGKDMTTTRPANRHIAQVFQFPVVYDTMTVHQNLEFPLKNRGMDAVARSARVEDVADALGLTEILGASARNLASGTKQLIALGRGLVRTEVNAILFDEPLTMIDPQLKWELRSRLKQLHARFDVTMIYVTHDQTEALTFADQIMVMNQGRILQTGSAQDLFDRPDHQFVGHFVGSPGMNFLPCTIQGSIAQLSTQHVELARHYDMPDRKQIALGIRPEHLHFTDSDHGIPATLTGIMDAGSRKIASLQCDGLLLKLVVPGDFIPSEGEHYISFDPEHAHVYAGGERLDSKP